MKVKITDIHPDDCYYYRREEIVGMILPEAYNDGESESPGWYSIGDKTVRPYGDTPGYGTYFWKVKFEELED
jgi:hypothetical protein